MKLENNCRFEGADVIFPQKAAELCREKAVSG